MANLGDNKERAFLSTLMKPTKSRIGEKEPLLPVKVHILKTSSSYIHVSLSKAIAIKIKWKSVIKWNSWELLLDCLTALYYLFLFICYQQSKREFSKVKHMKMLRTAATLLFLYKPRERLIESMSKDVMVMFVLLRKQRQLSSSTALPLLSSPPSLVLPWLNPLCPHSTCHSLNFLSLFFSNLCLLLITLFFISSHRYTTALSSHLFYNVKCISSFHFSLWHRPWAELDSVGSDGVAECL